jgi:hypothetical protein
VQALDYESSKLPVKVAALPYKQLTSLILGILAILGVCYENSNKNSVMRWYCVIKIDGFVKSENFDFCSCNTLKLQALNFYSCAFCAFLRPYQN